MGFLAHRKATRREASRVRRELVRGALVATLLAVGLSTGPARANRAQDAVAHDAGWELVHEAAEVRVERRPGRHSSCDEVRISTRVPVPPSVAADLLWEVRDERPFVEGLVASAVLRETDVERLVYGRIAVPVISDRAYVALVTRHVDETTGAHELRFGLVDEPLPEPHTVRLAVLEGAWRLEPAAGSRETRLEYRAEIDPGDLPAWLVNRLQRQRATQVVERYARWIVEHAPDFTPSSEAGS